MNQGSHRVEAIAALMEHLLRLSALAEARLRRAVSGLVQRDEGALAEVVADDALITQLHADIDERCFVLLALHQPVAGDLRTVMSVFRINSDLKHVGELAVEIAEASRRYLRHAPVKVLIDIPRMGDLAIRMLHTALEALVRRDVANAQAVLRQDDWLDALKDQVFRELLTYMLGSSETIEPSIDLILVSRHLERVGDHATNIAEDVIFIVEARDVRHRSMLGPQVERRRLDSTPPV
jgi:phosphate transport system protein